MLPDSTYNEPEERRSGSGYFSVNESFEPWGDGSQKTFYFASHSEIEDEEIKTSCYAIDLLGQENESQYTAYSTEVKFCGLPAVQRSSTYYYCIDLNGNITLLTTDYQPTEEQASTCKNVNDIMSKVSDWLNSNNLNDFYKGGCEETTYKTEQSECDNSGCHTYPNTITGFKCIHKYYGPSKTDGNCCASQTTKDLCTLFDTRYLDEYNNGNACSVVKITGCKTGCACVDQDTANRMNSGCFSKDWTWSHSIACTLQSQTYHAS